MLNVVAAAGAKFVVAGGSITDSNSALYNPNFKYFHHQIVSGAVFSAIVCGLLIAGMVAVAYRYWGPPAKRALAARGGVDDSTTLRDEGLLLGLQPWVWSIISAGALAVAVLS